VIPSHFFQPNNDGPFWMTKEESEKIRKDRLVNNQMTSRKLTKAELAKKLEGHGVMAKGSGKT